MFLKVRPKKGKKPFKNNYKEGYVEDRFFNIAMDGGLTTQIYKGPSFDEPLERYFANDLDIIG